MTIELLAPVQPHWKITMKKVLLDGPNTAWEITQGGVLLYRAVGHLDANTAFLEIKQIRDLTERLLR